MTIRRFEFKFTYLLHRRIEGVPNFRRIPMVLQPARSGNSSPDEDEESDFFVEGNGKMVCGWSVALRNIFRDLLLNLCVCISGMPTVEG